MNYLTHYQTLETWFTYILPVTIALGYVYYLDDRGLEDIEEVRVWMN